MPEKELRDLHINEFAIHELPHSCTMIVIGSPGSGKTTFIEDLCYANKHKYPVAKVWCGTEDTQGRFKQFVKDLYITNEYLPQEHEKSVIRQKMSKAEKCQNPNAIYIMDDCNTDRKIFRAKLMLSQFKNGSQWWDCLFAIGSHYLFDMPPDIRKCVSYVAIFQEPSPDERKKLYQSFSIGCTYREFCELMDELTGNFTCLVFKKRGQSNNMEDSIFYYKAREHEHKWELGCKEYKDWHQKRYNVKYEESFM